MIDPDKRKYLFKKMNYEPHSAGQWECHDSDKRFRILCCGRRWGKTTFGGNELTVAAMDHANPGYYWIVGPNYVQGEKEFRVVYHNLITKLGLGPKIKKQYNVSQGQMRIEMPWGTVIEVKYADRKDGLLGEGLKGVIMAEAARHDVDTWEMFVRPALADHRGWAIFASTPKGHNWYQGLWLMGQIRSLHPDYESWRLPSWTNNHVYPLGRDDPEILLIESTVSEPYFAQEIAAEFTSFVGKIYTDFDPKIHVPAKRIEYNPHWRNFWVFDYGFADPFVCLDVMVDPEDNVYVWREYQQRYLSSWEHGMVLKGVGVPDKGIAGRQNPERFRVDAMYGDPRGADAEATLALVLGQVFSQDVDRNEGYEAIRRWLQPQSNGKPKLFIDSSCTELIRQMENLHLKEAKDGRNAPEVQHDYDDHGPDALRYFFTYYFVHGYGSRLSDVYSQAELQGSGQTYFQHHTPFIKTPSNIGF
jgi:hypothetical protein